jgi:hypothetical protein
MVMFAGTLLDLLSPQARVAIAAAPFLAAIILRVAFGRNRITWWLITTTTIWFTINVLLAPFTAGMRQDLVNLRSMFR